MKKSKSGKIFINYELYIQEVGIFIINYELHIQISEKSVKDNQLLINLERKSTEPIDETQRNQNWEASKMAT